MGGSSSRSTVTPFRNVRYSVLSTGIDRSLIRGRLLALEGKLDKLQPENQVQAQAAVTTLKVLLNSPTDIPEDTLTGVERLVFDFSHFVENQGEEQIQQGKNKSSAKYSFGKTILAGIAGVAMGIIYSSFGDEDFNENESRGVTVIAGTVATTIMAVNELYTRFSIYRSESRQLVLAEKKAIHAFEVGILDVKKELEHTNIEAAEEAAAAFTHIYDQLLSQLGIIRNALKILTQTHPGRKAGVLLNDFEMATQALENKEGDLSDSLNKLKKMLKVKVANYLMEQQELGMSKHSLQSPALAILNVSAEPALKLVVRINELYDQQRLDTLGSQASYSTRQGPSIK